ncbi:MAG: IS1634 family transposase, partial [Thermoplasmata archaeon]
MRNMEAQEIIDLYKKRNRVEHCFRAINTLDLASPIYHWTPEKIRVHMFLSYLAYLFLSLIYNEARNIDESISLENVLDRLLSVNIIYMTDGKKEKKIINSNDDIGLKILKGLRLERFSYTPFAI